MRAATVFTLLLGLIGCSYLSSSPTREETFWLEVPGRGTVEINEELVPLGHHVSLEVEKGYMQAERELGTPVLYTADDLTILAQRVPGVYGDYADWIDTIRVSGGAGCPFPCIRVIHHEMQHRICSKLKLPVNCYLVDHTITLTGEPK